MGVVQLCKDHRVGREIAMKVIRPGQGSRSDARARFEREARVQGQLEHPSVVPVYDLGVRPDGSAFFTMKRVRGETLEDVLAKLRAGDAEAEATHTRRRLLGAFSSLCLAVAFAHARGVVHRDLKPGNIMLGAYGELYILDWGLAKLLGEREPPGEAKSEELVEAPMSRRHATAVGAVMGTPGYMPPEQIRGEVDQLDERADVFALGAILFEILTLTPLFNADSAQATLLATLRGADARASARAPDRAIPPELDALCERATRADPAERLGSARELHEAVERVLDGDRDREQRRAMADGHAARAGELFTEGAAEGALREASAALAIEPAHPAALGLMVRLLLDLPAELPAEARAELTARSAAVHVNNRGPAYAYATFLALLPAAMLLGVRSAALLGGLGALALAAFAVALWASRRRSFEGAVPLAVFGVSTLFILGTTAFMGPFILVPGMLAANVTSFVAFGDPRSRPLFLGAGTLGLILPAGLELAGLLPSSYAFSDAGMTVLPHLVSFPRAPTLLFLLVANLALVLTPAILFARVRDALSRNEERLFAYTWRLRQLLPVGARGAPIPAGAAAPEVCTALHDHLGLPTGARLVELIKQHGTASRG
jgi:serine/threonine-protein kinase